MKKTWFITNHRYLFACVGKFLKIMKITVFIIAFATMQTFALNNYAQSKRMDVKIEQESIVSALEKIEAQSEFFFFYNNKVVKLDKKVSIDLKQKTINEILDELFMGTDIEYTINNRQIILSGKEMGRLSSQQEKKIYGKVTDQKGAPIPGASVVVKGTTYGITTDIEGKFSLILPNEAKILQFSFIGMKSQEVAISGKPEYNVVLSEQTIGLDEVVAIGYGTKNRRDVIGAISTVNENELTIAPIASSTNALIGQVPGLQSLQASGEPGADAANISIRGFGNALIIVDGVESSFNNIDATSIESISVLKDASAAIYGARAGNGVILVTTKRGKLGKPTINFNSSYTNQGYIYFPKPCNAGEYTQLYTETQINSGVDPSATKYSQADIQKYYAGTDPNYPNTNWWAATMKNWSPMEQNNLSLSGGNENVKYYEYIGVMNQTGMFKSGDNVYNRYNVRSNIDATVTKNLSMTLDLSAILDDQTGSSSSLAEGGSFWNDWAWALPTYAAYLPDKTKVAWAGGATSSNPIIDSRKAIGGYSSYQDQSLNGSLALNYKIPGIKGLTARAFANYQGNTTTTKAFNKEVQTYSYDYTTKVYTPRALVNSQGSSLSMTETKSRNITGQFSLNFDRTFKENHHVSAMALYEVIDYYSENFWAARTNYISSAIDQLFAGNPNDQTNSGSASQTGRESYIGRVSYDYKHKYLLESTTRYDGSPNFPSDKRWGLFPSLSAGWRISEESFLKNNVTWLSSLKLRASYSNTGYDAIGAFQYITGYNIGQVNEALNGGVTQVGVSSTGVPNPDITWERMHTYNLGLDFGLLDNTLYGELDVFKRNRNGILGTKAASLPITFGAVLPDENLNSTVDHGYEILLGYRKKINDFSFDVRGSFSYARAKWIHYDEPAYTTPDAIRVNQISGKYTDLIWGYKTAGLFKSQTEIDNLGYVLDGNNNTTIHVGDIHYLDTNHDGVFDWKDQQVIGKSGLPKLNYSFNINLKYKNFDFTSNFQGADQRSVSVRSGVDSERVQSEYLFLNRWSENNPNPNAIYPRQSLTSLNYTYNSDYWTKNVSYCRLKTASIGYNIPKDLLSKIHVASVRIYVSGTNLFTLSSIAKYHIDPEVAEAVYEPIPGQIYPQQRTLSLGLNASF